MKINIILPIIVLAVLCTLDTNAQATTTVVEDVILFNNKPYKVRMTQRGKILSFLNDVDNSYAALNKVGVKKLQMALSEVDGLTDLARVNGDKMELEAVIVEEVSEESGSDMIAENVIQPEEDMNAKGKDKSTDYEYEFAFDHRDATLSPSSVNQLNQIAKILLDDENARLEIKSYYSETVDVSKILSKNRTNSILDMLIKKGVGKEKIKINESNNEDWANNKVQLAIH